MTNTFPLPPNAKRPIEPEQTTCGDPPRPDKEKGKLTSDDIHFILKSTLKPCHHSDPAIIKYIATYVQCRDNKQASRAAGIHANSGHALRNRRDIHDAIAKITSTAAMKYGFGAEEVIERFKEINDVDPADVFNEDGTVKHNMHDIAPETRRAIKKFKAKNLYQKDPNGITEQIGVLVEVEFWSKEKAGELLGREKKLFKETHVVEHDVTTNMKDILLASQEASQKRIESHREEREAIDIIPTNTPKDKESK